MAGELLMGISQDERERAIFRSRRMYQTDLLSNLATAEARGERNKQLEIARKLLPTSLSIEQISQATGLTLEEVKDLSEKS